VIDREPLFRATPPERRVPSFEYDVTSDGQRILMVEPVSSPQSQRLRIVTNWLALGR
jgi:hypothetical protein